MMAFRILTQGTVSFLIGMVIHFGSISKVAQHFLAISHIEKGRSTVRLAYMFYLPDFLKILPYFIESRLFSISFVESQL
jgi:hypothetical protein